MARLPALVKVIKAMDDREPTTIEQMARYIREAGHIQTTKRGSGAAEMTPRDAAFLLLGIASAQAPKDAALEAERKFGLRAHPANRYVSIAGALGGLRTAETLGEAITLLIAEHSKIAQELREFVRKTYGFEARSVRDLSDNESESFANYRVSLSGFSAKIVVSHFGRNGSEVDAEFNYMVDVNRMMDGFYGRVGNTFRDVTISFDPKIIRAIGAALNGSEGQAHDDV